MSDTLEESRPAHAPLGPSSAEGWSTCADYVNANRGLPDYTTEPAAEGTSAHAISDICVQTGMDADDFLGMPTRINEFLFAWEEEDAMLLQIGLDKLREAAGDAIVYGEQRVDISPWTLPGQFGTLDRAYIMQHDDGAWWVVIEDLKWGRGIPVSPVENKQLMLYALGFWQAIGRHVVPLGVVVRFRLIIDQPRHGGGGGVWETDLGRLLAFGEWIRGRAVLTAEPNASRTASLKGCMWCRRRRTFPAGRYGGCNTYDEYMLALLGWSWDDIDIALMMGTPMTLPINMTPERASFVLTHKDAVKRWFDDIESRIMEDAARGADTGEVKLVRGNKNPDTWVNKGGTVTPIVTAHLGDRGFNKRLKTPKQMLEAASGNDAALKAIKPHIVPGEKRLILVPLADAREPVVTGAVFDELEEGTQ